jgi:hypothetical protein
MKILYDDVNCMQLAQYRVLLQTCMITIIIFGLYKSLGMS